MYLSEIVANWWDLIQVILQLFGVLFILCVLVVGMFAISENRIYKQVVREAAVGRDAKAELRKKKEQQARDEQTVSDAEEWGRK